MMKKILIFGMLVLCANVICLSQSDKPIVDTIEVIASDSTNLSNDDKTQILVNQVTKRAKNQIEAPPQISELISISNVFWAIVFLVVGYFIIKFISRILEISAERSTKYRITIKSFIPVIKILGWVVLIFIIIAGIFKPPAATVLAFSASIGVAVGFAAQDIIKNIFGGIMILFDRPFKTGDKIELGGYYGEVVTIGLRCTRIVTPDDSLVSIPNSEVMNKSVSNANAGESNCQVIAEIYLPIDADTSKVRAIATQAAQVSKYVFINKPIVIVFANEYKDRRPLIKMKIKAYVLDIRDEFKFKSEMTEIAIKMLLEEGIIKSKY